MFWGRKNTVNHGFYTALFVTDFYFWGNSTFTPP